VQRIDVVHIVLSQNLAPVQNKGWTLEKPQRTPGFSFPTVGAVEANLDSSRNVNNAYFVVLTTAGVLPAPIHSSHGVTYIESPIWMLVINKCTFRAQWPLESGRRTNTWFAKGSVSRRSSHFCCSTSFPPHDSIKTQQVDVKVYYWDTCDLQQTLFL
jgi:hypothetical protein